MTAAKHSLAVALSAAACLLLLLWELAGIWTVIIVRTLLRDFSVSFPLHTRLQQQKQQTMATTLERSPAATATPSESYCNAKAELSSTCILLRGVHCSSAELLETLQLAA
jgi:hypothetical protein